MNESYSGIPIPEGWQRVSTGTIQASDALYDAILNQWAYPPDWCVGGNIDVFYCVIRKKGFKIVASDSYNGTPIPDGWQRIRSGLIESGDRALGDGNKWVDLPERYAGGGVAMFCCVIRKIEATSKESVN